MTNKFGFRNKHSTTHALIKITEKIRKALVKKQFACGIFIDLQKAFDTINHNILLNKSDYYDYVLVVSPTRLRVNPHSIVA